MNATPPYLTAPTFEPIQGVRHAFFTRQGGVSDGLYASLNGGIGSNDRRSKVLENRERMKAALGGEALLTVYQHHSTTSIRTAAAWEAGCAPRADAIVTAKPGLVVCALAADCGPVLFADPHAKVVAAAHAGWKGALDGVLEATLEAMEAEGATRDRIIAVLGPCISRNAYEVGPEFKARFVSANIANDRFFEPSQRANHSMFDLPAYILARLQAAGVAASTLDRCTYGEPDLFYSYRRSTHQREPDYGRLVSAIMLT
ncbi:MAG: peptidoglycan editing factor PgeF [Pseudomonadota bacterium]